MLKTNRFAEHQTQKGIGKKMRFFTFYVFLFVLAGFGTACRYDMQDQPRYKPFKKSDFFTDGRASRDLPAGVVARVVGPRRRPFDGLLVRRHRHPA